MGSRFHFTATINTVQQKRRNEITHRKHEATANKTSSTWHFLPASTGREVNDLELHADFLSAGQPGNFLHIRPLTSQPASSELRGRSAAAAPQWLWATESSQQRHGAARVSNLTLLRAYFIPMMQHRLPLCSRKTSFDLNLT